MIDASSPTRVLVVGSLTIDRIEVAGRCSSRIGGVVTYASLTLVRHGLPVAAVFQVADEDGWAADRLATHGVRVSPGASSTTTRFVHRIEGDCRQQWMPSAARSIPVDHVRAHLQGVQHVHFGPLHGDDIDPGVFNLSALRATTVSLDIQGYVRGLQATRVVDRVDDRLRIALGLASHVKASDEELSLVCRAWGLDEAALLDAFEIAELVVTSGSRGGYVRARSGDVTRIEPSAVDRVVDTTGAGDVFFAAWLARRVHQGAPIDAACEHAAWVAARHVEGRWLPPGILEPDSDPDDGAAKHSR